MFVTVYYQPTLIEYYCRSTEPEALIEAALKAKPNDELRVGDGIVIIRRPRRKGR